MRSLNDLLGMVCSDKAERLLLHAGSPPIMLVDRKPHALEGPPLTPENVDDLLNSIIDTRQKRELREKEVLQFVYRFRDTTDFLVQARLENGSLEIEIH